MNDVNINDLKPNKGQLEGLPENPRFIRNEKFAQLILSILVFPKMLEFRPITYVEHDGEKIILGGNQRRLALTEISKMSISEIEEILTNDKYYNEKPESEQLQIIKYWNDFFENNKVPAQNATGLTIAQQREFIIKDNVAFGQDDWDLLANEWEQEELNSWGMDLPIDYEIEEEEEEKKEPLPDTGIIAIALNTEEQKTWNEAKQLIGYQTDKTAFIKLVEKYIEDQKVQIDE